jgi:spore maturation protein CgeB
MRILVVGKFYEEGFALHIAETLHSMGHAVRRYDPSSAVGSLVSGSGGRLAKVLGVFGAASDNIPSIRRWSRRSLWNELERSSPELVLVCHDFLWPNEVDEIRRRCGAPIVMWFPDALVNFHRGFFLTAKYDALFFKDPYIVFRLAGVLKAPVRYLPECFNPVVHCADQISAEELSQYRCDITTAGHLHSWRVAVFDNLTEFDVKIWGGAPPLWMPRTGAVERYQGRPVHNREKVLAFRGAKIVLNSLHYGEIWGVNVRCFEAAGAGAFQLIDWRPGIDQLFKVGVEVVTYRSIAQVRERVLYWLPREREREEIAAKARVRAFAEHTYRHRLSMLLESVFRGGEGFPLPFNPGREWDREGRS